MDAPLAQIAATNNNTALKYKERMRSSDAARSATCQLNNSFTNYEAVTQFPGTLKQEGRIAKLSSKKPSNSVELKTVNLPEPTTTAAINRRYITHGITHKDLHDNINELQATVTDTGEIGLLAASGYTREAHSLPLATPDERPMETQHHKKQRIALRIEAHYNLGANITSIHPKISLLIPLSKKAFLSAGMGLNSQLRIKGLNPKEFVVLNDTVNQVYFTMEETKIRKAVYMDLPISFNYNLNKKISIGAGIQISVLQHTDVQREKNTFDFQSNLSREIAISPATTGTIFTAYQRYANDYKVMKTNGRLIAAASYKFRDLGIQIQYAKSITPNYQISDFNGIKREKRLSVLTVGFNYHVR